MMDKKLTIVGPEPFEPEKQKLTKKPHIETVLLMATYNPKFRKKLFTNRAKALTETGLEFTTGEKILLSNVTNHQLKENIDKFKLPGITKKSLSTWTKAAAVLMLIVSLTLTFTTTSCKGISPDIALEEMEDNPEYDNNEPTRGIAPDDDTLQQDEKNQ